jgi:hypothetical protein
VKGVADMVEVLSPAVAATAFNVKEYAVPFVKPVTVYEVAVLEIEEVLKDASEHTRL